MVKVANPAQLTSKFVGETSRNLQKLFREVRPKDLTHSPPIGLGRC